jgi:hypothetical protein
VIGLGMTTITECDAVRFIRVTLNVIDVVDHPHQPSSLVAYLAGVVVAFTNLLLERLVERFGVQTIPASPRPMLFTNKISLVAFLRTKLPAVLSNTSLHSERFRAVEAGNVNPAVGLFTGSRTEASRKRHMLSHHKRLVAVLARFFNLSAPPIGVIAPNVVIIEAGAATTLLLRGRWTEIFSANFTPMRLEGSLRSSLAFARTVFAGLRRLYKKLFSALLATLLYLTALPARMILFSYKACWKPNSKAEFGTKLFMRVARRRFELLSASQAVLNHVTP